MKRYSDFELFCGVVAFIAVVSFVCWLAYMDRAPERGVIVDKTYHAAWTEFSYSTEPPRIYTTHHPERWTLAIRDDEDGRVGHASVGQGLYERINIGDRWPIVELPHKDEMP